MGYVRGGAKDHVRGYRIEVELRPVEFAQRLRPMAAFEDVDALLVAMAKDVTDTRQILGM